MSALIKASIPAYEFHEAANIFPLMSDDEYSALVEDMRANGLRESLWLFENKIIDGRNRYRACCELGIEPRVRIWKEKESLVNFVISKNLHRRHLSSGQRAVIALEVEKLLSIEAKAKEIERKTTFQKIEKSPTRPIHAAKQAAKLTGTNHQYVSDAKKIVAKAPEVAERVKQGKMEMQDAKALANVNDDQRKAALTLLDNGYADSGREAVAVVLSHNPDNPKALEDAASYPPDKLERREITEGEKWQKSLSDLLRKLSAVDSEGGMKKKAAKWGNYNLSEVHRSICFALSEMSIWKTDVEKLMKERNISYEA